MLDHLVELLDSLVNLVCAGALLSAGSSHLLDQFCGLSDIYGTDRQVVIGAGE